MNTPFIPADQLQRMITNQLFQGLKLGPNAAPFNPVPYQVELLQSQITTPSDPVIASLNPPGIIPPVPTNYMPGSF
jgi:hypothetical protein